MTVTSPPSAGFFLEKTMNMNMDAKRAYALKLALFDVFVRPEGRQDTLYTYQDGAWSFFGYWDGTVHADPLDDGSWEICASPLSTRFGRVLRKHLPELYGSQQQEEPTLPFEDAPARARMAGAAQRAPYETRKFRICKAWKEHRQSQWRADCSS